MPPTLFFGNSLMTSSDPVKLALHAMATRFELLLCGAEPSRLRAAGEEALEEITFLDRQLSFYDPNSEISRVNALAAKGPVKVEPRILQLLKKASELSAATGGAFDITIAPLMKIWGLTGGTGRIPTDDEIDEVMQVVGMRLIHMNEEESTIAFDREGVKIDLGAIGKGYAIDRAVEVLKDSGVRSALVHGGTSTIYAIGVTPDGSPWRVAVRNPHAESEPHPQRKIDLCDSSLSVSAVHGKSFTCDGQQYGHVIDPRSGRPTRAAALAAVSGPSATETDALSTALLVLGDDGPAMLHEYGRYSGWIIK